MARVVIGGSNNWRELTHPEKSMRASLTRDSRRVTRVFIIESPDGSYDNINRFLNECRPPFYPPGQYPVVGAQLFVDTVDVEPFSGVKTDEDGEPEQSLGFPAYTAYKAVVTYSPLPYQPKDEDQPNPNPFLDNLEIVTDIGAEAMTLPGSAMYWEGEADKIGNESVASAIRIDTINYRMTKHHQRPVQIPWDTIRTVNNTVNATDFGIASPLFAGVKRETLLFRGAQVSIRFSGDGTIENSVSYNFSERTFRHNGQLVTWNHLWDGRANQNNFKKIYTEPSTGTQNQSIYSTSTIQEFLSLFS